MNSNEARPSNVRLINAQETPLDELAALRNILLAPMLEKEKELDARVHQVRKQLDELDQRTRDCSQILGKSIIALHAQDKDLAQELEPEITAGVDKCFKNQPERMAEVLYPILGPAVRKLVASLFQGSSGEAGKPYVIEQLFLIHKETSLVLADAVLDPSAERDADLVSGMLDAIRSFVQEAFSLKEFDGMNSIKLGDLTIWVEWGPKAILAVVVRGFPDQSVQDHYADLLRLIHYRYESELSSFDGDTDSFGSLDLAAIDTESGGEHASAKPVKPLFTLTRLALICMALMLLITNHVSDKRAWQSTLKSLANEPGVVVINEKRGWTQNTLSLLHDPLAAPRDQVLEEAGIELEDVSVSWFRFQSQDSLIVRRRTKQEFLLKNPSLNSRSAGTEASVHSRRPL